MNNINFIKIISILLFLNGVLSLQAEDIYTISTGPEDDGEVLITKPIVIEAYKRIGIEAQVDHHPWARALELSSSGDTDGELHRVKAISSKFESLIIVNEPVLYIDFVAFAKQDKNIFIKKWEDLKPYTFTYVRGIKLIESNTQEMNVEPVRDFKTALKLLELDRVDVVLDTYYNAIKEIELGGYTNFQLSSDYLARIPLYHFVHKRNAHLVPKLEEALREMKKEGIIKK